MKQGSYIISITGFIVFILSLVTSAYAYLVLILFFTILMVILYKLGKAIVLRDIIALYSSFTCLLMPLIGYEYYPKSNFLSRVFVKFMRIPFDDYFSYCLPAMALFTMALCWPFNRKGISDEGTAILDKIPSLQRPIAELGNVPLIIILTGILAFYITPFMPQSLQFPFTLIYLSSFVGIMYVYFRKDYPRRNLILGGFIAFILLQALQMGMFTIVAYMGMTIFSFILLGRRISIVTKLLVLASCIFALVIIQSVKAVYRDYIWRGKGGQVESKTLLYSKLVSEKVSKIEDLFTMDAMFPLYMRTNQGFNVALVMRRIPSIAPHDNGANIFLSITSAFVPRLFWPDKPMAGGKYNMKYYTGINIVGWSTNVGPLGEAYGSFGVGGGILYMFLLGLFIRGVYQLIFLNSRKMPLLIFWIPLLFYEVSYSAENDTLQIFNSLLKAGIFVYIIYRIWPPLFGVPRKTRFGSAAMGKNVPALS